MEAEAAHPLIVHTHRGEVAVVRQRQSQQGIGGDRSSVQRRHGHQDGSSRPGVFAFRPEIDEYWDFRVWSQVDAELSVQRGAERDQDRAGTDAESIHRNRYLVAEHIYLQEVDPLPMTDIVIDNSEFTRPRIVTS
ncbi:hypothetical protein AB0942_16650 [Streptomyces nodosus]|uniref:hypothetical protein n=1 Tax=Streptomyces nodosus TaxID=40318 RepID=UPI003452A203